MTIALGVIAVAAIYQLSTPGGNTLTGDVTKLGSGTVSTLFTGSGGNRTPAKQAA
ncbi:MAG: hypothetical protein ABSC73_09085 [Acidimicrobiales bacterium]